MATNVVSVQAGAPSHALDGQGRWRMPLVYLAVMRLVVAYFFLTIVWEKFVTGVVTGAAGATPRMWIAPGPGLLGYWEVAIAMSLASGALVRIGATLGLLYSANVYFGGGNNAVMGFHRTLIMLCGAFIIASAGRTLGVDQWLHRKFSRNPLF